MCRVSFTRQSLEIQAGPPHRLTGGVEHQDLELVGETVLYQDIPRNFRQSQRCFVPSRLVVG